MSASLKDTVAEALAAALNIPAAEAAAALAVPQDQKMGDLALPCFKFAKILKKAPPAIAAELKAKLNLPADLVERIEVAGGYLNFFAAKAGFAQSILNNVFAQGQTYGSATTGAGKTVVLDFSSPNAAKPFHAGHLGTTIIGESLARLYQFTGHKVVRVNHLGDWGVQNGFQVLAWKRTGEKKFAGQKPTVSDLAELYIAINEEAKIDPELDLEARRIFKAIEDGNQEYLAISNMFRDISIAELVKVYADLDIKFDSYNGEAFQEKNLQPMLQLFRTKPGFLIESRGAQVVELKEEFGIDAPCIVMKADGASIYATRDLATAIWRANEYHFDKNVYVTDLSQEFHFKQFFSVLKKFGFPWATDDKLVHVATGRMSLRNDDGTVVPMSTREGTMIPLTQFVTRMQQTVRDIIAEKNPELPNPDAAAKALGYNAIKFWIQSKGRLSSIVFDWKEATNPQGATGPYLNYTYARMASILKKVADQKGLTAASLDPAKISSLDDPKETAVLKRLEQFAPTIQRALTEHEPSILAAYLIDLAQDFN
ncbi:MAG TPA: arginine--tRNA ligase, partial [Planctomycetota bacterium]|nr:arginine--tRNA ligase [Planctomycetota bacterium]